MGEFDYIRWLRQRVPAIPRVEVGIGEDCAVVDLPRTKCLITADMLPDGTHFRLAECGPRRVGRKALAVNLIDIAAMGDKPNAAVVSLALPRQGTGRIAEIYSRLSNEELMIAKLRVEGLDWVTIAAQRGGKPGTLRKKLHRAIARISHEVGLGPQIVS